MAAAAVFAAGRTGTAPVPTAAAEPAEIAESVPPLGHDEGLPEAGAADVELTLEVDPHDAEVFIEGMRLEDDAPVRTLMLQPRLYRVRVSKTGYPEREFMVDLKSGRKRRIRIELTQITEILIRWDNPAAKAMLDGVTELHSGLPTRITPGVHELKIYVKEYEAVTEKVDIPKGSQLERTYGISLLAPVEIVAYPRETEIYLDNERLGMGYWTGELPTDKRNLIFKHTTLGQKKYPFNPKPGEKFKLTLSMPSNRPENSKVWYSILLFTLPESQWQRFSFISRSYDLVTLGYLLAVGGTHWPWTRWGMSWEIGVLGLGQELRDKEFWAKWLHLGAGPTYRLSPGHLFGIEQYNRFDLWGDESNIVNRYGATVNSSTTNRVQNKLSWLVTHQLKPVFRFGELRVWPLYQWQWGQMGSVGGRGLFQDWVSVHALGAGIDYSLPGVTLGAEGLASPFRTDAGNRNMEYASIQVFLRLTGRVFIDQSAEYRRRLREEQELPDDGVTDGFPFPAPFQNAGEQ